METYAVVNQKTKAWFYEDDVELRHHVAWLSVRVHARGRARRSGGIRFGAYMYR